MTNKARSLGVVSLFSIVISAASLIGCSQTDLTDTELSVGPLLVICNKGDKECPKTGTRIKVAGKVESVRPPKPDTVDKDSYGLLLVFDEPRVEGRFRRLHCYFAKGDTEKFAKVTPGKRVVVKGMVAIDKYEKDTISLLPCELVSAE
jgi:hypothetical protein